MTKQTFTYVTYIVSTPHRVLNAITEEAFQIEYWFGHRLSSDWCVGSSWEMVDYDAGMTCWQGKVLESDKPSRLVLSWARPDAEPDDVSVVEIDVEPMTDFVKLTVTHRDLVPGSAILENISEGWPMIMASLKSILETGKAVSGTVVGSRSGLAPVPEVVTKS